MRLILSALLGLAAAIKIKSKTQQWDDDFNYESLYGQYENDMPTGGKTDDYYYSDNGNDDYGTWADYGTDGTWDDDYYGDDYGDDYGSWDDDDWYGDDNGDDYGTWGDYGTDGSWDDDYWYGDDYGDDYNNTWGDYGYDNYMYAQTKDEGETDAGNWDDAEGDDWSSDDYEGAGDLHEYYEDAGEVAEDAYWAGVDDADDCFNYGDCDAVEENHVFTYEYYLEYGDDGDDDYYGDDNGDDYST